MRNGWKKGVSYIEGSCHDVSEIALFEQDEDGYLHIRHVNNHEDLWDACDTISELAGIHGILPVAVQAARILQKDEGLCREWEAFEKK